tara:strand:+ start:244 stop:459 length:216 start_codon:yes stop_codon:yes gene_type:complete
MATTKHLLLTITFLLFASNSTYSQKVNKKFNPENLTNTEGKKYPPLNLMVNLELSIYGEPGAPLALRKYQF